VLALLSHSTATHSCCVSVATILCISCLEPAVSSCPVLQMQTTAEEMMPYRQQGLLPNFEMARVKHN